MDATTRSRIEARLIAEIDEMPRLLRQVAKYIIDNPADFGLDTIRKSANKIGVSPNTLVRMADHLNLDSFDDLREPFRQSLITSRDELPESDWIARRAQDGELGGEHAKVLRNEVSLVNRSLRSLTPQTVQDVLADLTGAKHAFVTATRSSYALAHYFHYVGRMAMPGMRLVPRHMGAAIEDIAEITKEDVLFAITFLPYSAETIQALRFANTRGAKVILMTDSELVAPNIKVNHLLRVASQSTHHFGCYAGAMAVLDCLLAHLVKQGGSEARARIARYEDLRQDSGAYWKPSLPRIKR